MSFKKLHVGFITYEYPPDIGMGGIATYTEQVATILNQRGHRVEVFCGSHTRNITETVEGVLVHRVMVTSANDFRNKVLLVFEAKHIVDQFDIIESPEINANGLEIKKKFPNLPLIVKLHTPAFLIVKLNHFYTGFWIRLRFFLGSLRRGRIQFWGEYRNKEEDLDFQITKIANHIVSPSVSLKEIIILKWGFVREQISIVPNPYIPSDILLSYPIEKNVAPVVTFIGKLNEHKGVVSLVRAIPFVIKQFPDILFRFIGNDGYSTLNRGKMSDYILDKLKSHRNNFEILEAQTYSSVLSYLGKTEICVFPSLWENFPMVCLEAMSAGCAVVGSKHGGMSEMLSDNAGLLIEPSNPRQIARALILLLQNQDLRNQFGTIARKKVLDHYNVFTVGVCIEDSYFKAIEKSKF